MPADFGTLTCTVESLHASDLFSKWKEITNTLVAYGHATKLHQELNSRTGHGNSTGNHIAYQRHEHSPRGLILSDESQLIANGTDINRSSNELAIPDEDVWAESPNESESVNDIYDEIIVPPHLIIEAADLSQYNHINSPLSFEKILAQECSLARYNSEDSGLEGVLTCVDNDLTMLSDKPPFPLTLSPSELEQNRWRHSDLEGISEQDPLLQAKQQECLTEETKRMTSPTSPPQRRKPFKKARGLRLSDKKNLAPTDIPMVADLLINPDAISYFLCHCSLIYEKLMPFSAQQSQGSDNNIKTSVVVALDMVRELLKSNRLCRLRLRFACVLLTWSIDAFKAVAATDRERKVRRSVGQRDATVAINLYLEAKQKVSGEKLERSEVLRYCRTGRRWAELAGRSSLLVFIFPQMADTIVYVPFHTPLVETHGLERQNNSIRDSTLRALAARIEQNRPELIRSLTEVSEYAGLTCSHKVRPISRLEDVVTKTHQVLGPTLRKIPH
jgi:hypothetical protein